MVQDQLVEYISSQMAAGVSRDTIKNTLTGAGWQAADVEDTLKKVESTKTSQPITTPSTAATVATSAKPLGPQTIKMSDLISTSDPVMSSGAATSTKPSSISSSSVSSSQKVFTGASPVQVKPGATSYTAAGFSDKPRSSHGALITEIILGVLVVGIGALAGYLYFQNNTLNAQVAAANTTNGSSAQQLVTLQKSSQASTTAMQSQIATLSNNNSELQAELSFYAVPPNTSSGVTSTATLNGTLSGGGKLPYLITATYGAKIYISNSKDASVTLELAPIAANSSTASFTGIYLPGADSMTLTAVNGTSL
jgi:Tfp pilus assembly protein PilE